MFEAEDWERSWRERLPEALPETVVEGSFGVLAALGCREPEVLALLLEVFTDLHRGSTRTVLGPSRWLPALDAGRGKGVLVEAGLVVDLGDAVAGAAVHRREQAIRGLLDARSAQAPGGRDAGMQAAVAAMDDLGDDQRAALERAASASTLAVVGGPGTGKTWLTARLVRAWLTAGIPARRVACLAPTGKAAQRLGEALADLPVPPPQTLHRLLGWASDPTGPERVPPPVDAVLVDEASMVELEMMERLLTALNPERWSWSETRSSSLRSRRGRRFATSWSTGPSWWRDWRSGGGKTIPSPPSPARWQRAKRRRLGSMGFRPRRRRGSSSCPPSLAYSKTGPERD